MSATGRPYACHIIFSLLLVALIAAGAKLLLFQTQSHAAMISKAQGQQRIMIDIPGRRGDIYGRSYSMPVLLAGSRQASRIFIDPMMIAPEQVEQVAKSVAKVLGQSAERIQDELEEGRENERRFVVLADDVDEKTVQAVRALRNHAVGIKPQWRREYPNGSLAAHVIGFAGRDANEQETGMEGIELYADKYLRAENGYNVLWGDASRRAIWDEPNAYQPPRDGHAIQLTIDVVVQRFLEEQLAQAVAKNKAESAIGIVMDPRNGEILALACEPTFDLNEYNKAEDDQRRNRAITDPFEPGSIFKPFTASAALAMGKVHYGQIFFCNNGAWDCRRGRTLHDVHGGYGNLTVEDIVIHSSNIGMAHIGEILGNERLYRIITTYGFGKPTGIELKGEDAGLVNKLPKWTMDSKWSIPMGQEVGVTGLQMITAFSSIANDGLLLRPKLVRAVYGADGQVEQDRAGAFEVKQVIASELIHDFRLRVLAKVPTEGTGKAGRLAGWSSFGKTGTAQIPPYGSGYTSSYVAGAPLEKPRLVCLISVRRPKAGAIYGGTVAAPVVKAILEQGLAYLDVPHDEEIPAKGGQKGKPADNTSAF